MECRSAYASLIQKTWDDYAAWWNRRNMKAALDRSDDWPLHLIDYALGVSGCR